MAPETAFHVTDLSATVPETDAENCTVPPVGAEAVAGETLTEFTTRTATVTVAEADFVLSALLVAVMVSLPAVAGAI